MNTALKTEYAPIPAKQFKATTNNKIKSFWDKELKNLGIEFESSEPGVICDVEHIGADHFIRTFQPYALDENGELLEGYVSMTIEELMQSRQQEGELIQFEVDPAKVEKFLVDTTIGLLKTRQLFSPIEVLYVAGEEAIIGGGRHRTTGIANLYRLVDGYEVIQVACMARVVSSKDEALNYIMASNASRTMTPFEKKKLAASRRGLTMVRSGDELLEKINAKLSLTDLGGTIGLYFAAEGAEQLDTTLDTLGKIGSTFVTNLTKLIKELDSKAPKVVYYWKSNDECVAATLARYALKTLVQNWEAYLDDIKETIRDRKTGKPKVDEQGNTVYSYNVSRNTSTIAKNLAEGVFASLESELKAVFTEAQKAEAEENKVKEAEKEAKQYKKQVSKLDTLEEFLSGGGINLPPEVLAQIAQAKAEAEAKAAQVAAQVAAQAEVQPHPVSEERSNQLDALLS